MELKKYKISKVGMYGVITPVPDGVLMNTLAKYLQYTKKNAEFFPNPLWAIVRLYNYKRGFFPWGLLDTVISIMMTYKAKSNSDIELQVDVQKPDVNHELEVLMNTWKQKGLWPFQASAIERLIVHGGGIISIPTGGGKTRLAIEYLRIMNKRALVIVTTLDIKRQWEKDLLPDDNVVVMNWQRKEIKDIVGKFDIIVMDEVHHAPAKNIYKTAMKAATNSVLVGLSGTPYREDGEEMLLWSSFGRIIYEISRKELIEQGVLCNAEVRYLNCDFASNGKYQSYQDIYKSEIVENGSRNKRITLLACDESMRNRRVLILVTQVSHGQELLERIKKMTYQGRVAFIYSGNKKEREMKLEDFSIIIATSLFDEGVNIPSLDVLIIAAGGKSSIKLTQRVGRVLRMIPGKNTVTIYDFIDTPRYLRTHYKKRRELLEGEFNVTEEGTLYG